MPPHAWPLTLNELAIITNAWPPNHGSLLTWAIWAADGLHFLLEQDDRVFSAWPRDLGTYPEEAIDLAHVRWASGSAITVLDLCAGTLGRRRCPKRKNEYSLRDFDLSRAKGSTAKNARSSLIDELHPSEQAWVNAATTDGDYETALNARNPMTHSRLHRTVYAGTAAPGPHEYRTGFPVGPGGTIVDSRPLIELCSGVVTRHLEAFLNIIKSGV